MRISAQLNRLEIPLDGVGIPLDSFAFQVEDRVAIPSHDRDIAVLQVDDRPRVSENCRGIRCDEEFALFFIAQAKQHRGPFAGDHDLARIVL